VYRSYESSRLYRDIKLRGSILRDEELITLPLEQIFTKVTGVWNLSAEQGNLGTLYITNVRIVWHANLANNFNVSLPYWQIVRIFLFFLFS
jgi:Bardet-Biedl syndrome 5 protein